MRLSSQEREILQYSTHLYRSPPPICIAILRRPRSTYKKVVQGKCPLHFIDLYGVVCSNTLSSNASALTSSLLFRGNSTCKILEHLVWSNTSGFQFWGPLARTNFLSALCGLPKYASYLYRTVFGKVLVGVVTGMSPPVNPYPLN